MLFDPLTRQLEFVPGWSWPLLHVAWIVGGTLFLLLHERRPGHHHRLAARLLVAADPERHRLLPVRAAPAGQARRARARRARAYAGESARVRTLRTSGIEDAFEARVAVTARDRARVTRGDGEPSVAPDARRTRSTLYEQRRFALPGADRRDRRRPPRRSISSTTSGSPTASARRLARRAGARAPRRGVRVRLVFGLDRGARTAPGRS